MQIRDKGPYGPGCKFEVVEEDGRPVLDGMMSPLPDDSGKFTICLAPRSGAVITDYDELVEALTKLKTELKIPGYGDLKAQ